MKKRIALVYGGNSSEWEISVQSGKNVAANIDRERFDIYEILLRGASWRVVAVSSGSVAGCNAVELPEGGIEVDKTDFSFVYNGER